MRLALTLAGLLIVGGHPVAAATFLPEQGPRLGKRELARLTTSTRTIGGVRYAASDDMLFPAPGLFVSFSAARWPGGRFVYDATGLTRDQRRMFHSSCRLWENGAGVRCVARTTQRGGYVEVTAIEGRSSFARIGYPGPEAISHMQLCCFADTSHAAHEIGHALGMAHEQSRRDRSRYIAIQWANIKAGGKSQFRMRPEAITYGSYDFLSRMHYRQDHFTGNGKPTILVLPPNRRYQSVLGTRPGLSAGDLEGMRRHYS